jgi:hypothetical protein
VHAGPHRQRLAEQVHRRRAIDDAPAERARALEHAAVDQEAHRARLHQQAGAGDLAGRAEERQPHPARRWPRRGRGFGRGRAARGTVSDIWHDDASGSRTGCWRQIMSRSFALLFEASLPTRVAFAGFGYVAMT